MQRKTPLAMKVKPIKVICLDSDDSSVGYYRTILPFYTLNSMGLTQALTMADLRRDDVQSTDNLGNLQNALQWTSLVVVSRPYDLKTLRFMDSMKARGKKVIVDTDDNIEAIEQLKEPDMHDFWVKGNRQPIFVESLEKADSITVASRNLKEVYEKRYPDKVHYLANPVDTRSTRWNFPHAKHPESPFTIGWIAGPTHIQDADLISGAIKRIMAEYPEVHFKCGAVIPPFLAELPEARTEWVDGEPFWSYPKMFADVDVAVAPVLDHDFNQCRSDTKAFEATMAGCGVIASPVGELTRWADQKSILFAGDEEEWVYSLRMLIENPERLDDLRRQAQRFVFGFRRAEITVPQWYDAYRKTMMRMASSAEAG
jgi:processive 1,2-diacylglycerol beta-glucosyltransferase